MSLSSVGPLFPPLVLGDLSFSMQELSPFILRYAGEYAAQLGLNAGELAQWMGAIIHEDSRSPNGLLGLSDERLWAAFESWYGQGDLGSGAAARNVPVEAQIEFLAMTLGQLARANGSFKSAAQEWHGAGGGSGGDLYLRSLEGYLRGGQVQATTGGNASAVNTSSYSSPSGVGPMTLTETARASDNAMEVAQASHVTQWEPGGNAPFGYNDCGPTSAVMALIALGLRPPVDGQAAFAAIDGMRDRMVGHNTNYSQLMGFSDLRRGLAANGATTQMVRADTSPLDVALDNGGVVILGTSSTYAAWGASAQSQGQYLNSRDPKGHFVTVVGRTPEGDYIVNDPLVKGPVVVSRADMQKALSGSFGGQMLVVSGDGATPLEGWDGSLDGIAYNSGSVGHPSSGAGVWDSNAWGDLVEWLMEEEKVDAEKVMASRAFKKWLAEREDAASLPPEQQVSAFLTDQLEQTLVGGDTDQQVAQFLVEAFADDLEGVTSTPEYQDWYGEWAEVNAQWIRDPMTQFEGESDPRALMAYLQHERGISVPAPTEDGAAAEGELEPTES